jgi:hypothetical protein
MLSSFVFADCGEWPGATFGIVVVAVLGFMFWVFFRRNK